jgi:signal transduction histidine kinase
VSAFPPWWNTLSRRIILSALIGALGGALCTVAAASMLVTTVFRSRLAALAPALNSPEDLRCLSNPPQYIFDSGTVHVASAEYLAMSALNAERQGPAIDLSVRRRLDGPCSVYLVHWPLPSNRYPSIIATGLSLLVSTCFAIFLAALLAVRPVVRRVEALSRIATRVGDPSVSFEQIERESSDQLGVLAVHLKEAHRRVVAHAQSMEYQLSAVSHDLRTPLAALQLGLENARTTPIDSSEIEAMLDDVDSLASLADNLSIVVGLRHGLLAQLPSVDLTEVVRRVGRRFARLSARGSVLIDVAVPIEAVFVTCHPLAAEQALVNLMQNAIAHGKAGGHVALVLETVADRFILSVEDEGPGLANINLPTLEEAMRGGPHRASGAHLGLGLAIVRAAADQAKWQVTVETRPLYEGTRISLSGQVSKK